MWKSVFTTYRGKKNFHFSIKNSYKFHILKINFHPKMQNWSTMAQSARALIGSDYWQPGLICLALRWSKQPRHWHFSEKAENTHSSQAPENVLPSSVILRWILVASFSIAFQASFRPMATIRIAPFLNNKRSFASGNKQSNTHNKMI